MLVVIARSEATKAKARHICLEHPQVQPGARISCRKLTGDGTKELFTYPLTTSLRTNVKIVHKASPDGVEIAIDTDKRLCKPSRVEGNVD